MDRGDAQKMADDNASGRCKDNPLALSTGKEQRQRNRKDKSGSPQEPVETTGRRASKGIVPSSRRRVGHRSDHAEERRHEDHRRDFTLRR